MTLITVFVLNHTQDCSLEKKVYCSSLMILRDSQLECDERTQKRWKTNGGRWIVLGTPNPLSTISVGEREEMGR